MKEAIHYKVLKKDIVQCQLCPKFCTLKDNEIGKCKVRQNLKGKLYSLVYGKPCAIAVDPIEKKPLFHFLPGSLVYSIGTVGCPMSCLFCQNYTTSQASPEEVYSQEFTPEEIVNDAIERGCKIIAYTYNEPTIFYEFALDCAKVAKEKGIKNIMVTNGFINEKPAKELYEYIDSANVDLKSFEESFYKKICDAELKPVLNTLKLLKKMKVWLEVTNLVIPTLNDDPKMIKKMCLWIKENLGETVPLHFSRFSPMYKLTNIKSTPIKTLLEAKKIAESLGLKYIYVGNVLDDSLNNTYCKKCNEAIIKRSSYYDLLENHVVQGKCSFCKEKIEGVF